MIPLRDHNPSGKFPIITFLLIVVNILVFIHMFLLPADLLETFVEKYSLVPALIVSGQNLSSLITSIFLHAGLLHIGGNMLFLNIFGNNLEARLGHLRYLIFYFTCGIVASVTQIIADPRSTIPNLGASGAIAGLMGAYLFFFPKNRIDILFTFGFFLQKATIPAYLLLVYWFVVQIFSETGSLGIQNLGGVAYLAHIGGFLFGYLSAAISSNKNKQLISNEL